MNLLMKLKHTFERLQDNIKIYNLNDKRPEIT